MRFYILALGICLAGCAAGHSIVQNLPDSPAAQDLSEPNYRQIVADSMATLFPKDPVELGVLEISGVRPVSHLRGPAWLTCLRIHAEDAAQEYAVFILNNAIVDSRVGVSIDRCKQQTYQSYDLASFTQPKNPPKVQARKAGH